MNKYVNLGGAIALGAFFLLASGTAHAGNGKDALKLMPRDTTVVLSLDTRDLTRSKLAKDSFAALSQGSDVSDMRSKMQAAGIDFEKDIDTVVVSVAGDPDKADRILLFMEGRFDQKQMLKSLKAEGKTFANAKHNGAEYFIIDGDSEVAFVGKYFVAAPKGGITGVLDRARGTGKTAAQNRSLKRLARSSHSKKDIWMAMVLTASMRKEIASEAGGHSINTVVIGMDMKNDLDVAMRLGTSDGKAASALAAAFRAAVAEMAKEPSLSIVGLGTAFKNMTIKSTGTNVDVSISVSANSVQQMLSIVQNVL